MKKYSYIWINGLAALFNFIVAAVNYANGDYILMGSACLMIGLSLGVAFTLWFQRRLTQPSQEPL